MLANTNVSLELTWPVGSGLPRVRAILASISCSIKQLNAAAAPEASPIPTVAAINISSGTILGVARNIPIMAVNTISAETRGLHSGKKF